MAEAIAALSLAANILQMVEYGVVFVSTAWKICSSNPDTHLANDFDQLRSSTEEVEKILVSLEQNESEVLSGACLQDRDRDLLALTAESRTVTEDILSSLNKIENPAAWKDKKKYKAIKAAFKSLWHSHRLTELKTNLDRVRSQLTLQLLHSMRCVDNNL